MRFAAEMMKCVRDMDYAEFQLARAPDFKLRVGVSTGKVIAGVVGAQKPLYDIWGDTVNIASRMDYTGERGRIHLPEVSQFNFYLGNLREHWFEALIFTHSLTCCCRRRPGS